jgi:hypothetical protein
VLGHAWSAKGDDLVYAGKLDHGFDKVPAANLRNRLEPLVRKTQAFAQLVAHKGIGVQLKLPAEIEYRAKSVEGRSATLPSRGYAKIYERPRALRSSGAPKHDARVSGPSGRCAMAGGNLGPCGRRRPPPLQPPVLITSPGFEKLQWTRIAYFPVVNGDCSLITLSDNTQIIIDCNTTAQAGDETDDTRYDVHLHLLDFGKKLGDKKIPHVDVFILTHADRDHCRGFDSMFTRATPPNTR